MCWGRLVALCCRKVTGVLGEASHCVAERVGEASHCVAERVGEASHCVAERVGEASHCVAGRAQVCWGRLATVLQEGHRCVGGG